MKVKAANGFARILKSRGSVGELLSSTNHVNNALGRKRPHGSPPT